MARRSLMNQGRGLVGGETEAMREGIVKVMSRDPTLELVGMGNDGKQVIELCHARRPDVLVLDIDIAVVSAPAVTEYVMAFCPTPVLVLASSNSSPDRYSAFDRFSRDVVRVLEKP